MKIPHKTKRNAAFTLPEILGVLAVLGVLTALLVPAFGRMREGGYQVTCMSNLKQIGVAEQMYFRDERRHPASLALLLPPSSQIVVATGPRIDTWRNGSGGGGTINGIGTRAPAPDPNAPQVVAGTTGYIRDLDVIKCPDDAIENNVPTSSYEASAFPVWNYFGYLEKGDSHSESSAGAELTSLLVNPAKPYDAATNPVKFSLSNRFAPANTVVTHCVFHRMVTADIDDPTQLYENSQPGITAKDIILRVDGSAKALDVTSFATADPQATTWQKQDF